MCDAPKVYTIDVQNGSKKGWLEDDNCSGAMFHTRGQYAYKCMIFYLKILGSNIIHYLYIFCIFFTHVISFVEIFTHIDISDTFTSVHKYTPGTKKNHVASFQRDPQAGIVTDWVMERRGGRGELTTEEAGVSGKAV